MSTSIPPAELRSFRIVLTPSPNIFTAGVDPIRLLRQIGRFGDLLDCVVDSSMLSELAYLDPNECRLAWSLTLRTYRPIEAILEVFADLTMIVVCVALIVLGWPAIEMLAEFDQRSQAADIPLWIPQALVPIGLGLNAFLVAVRLVMRRAPSPAPAS